MVFPLLPTAVLTLWSRLKQLGRQKPEQVPPVSTGVPLCVSPVSVLQKGGNLPPSLVASIRDVHWGWGDEAEDMPDPPLVWAFETVESRYPSVVAIREQLFALAPRSEMAACDRHGRTPLMVAAHFLPAWVPRLIAHGDPDVVHAKAKENGWTALMYAAWKNPSAILALVDAGARTNEIDVHGQDSLCLLARHHPDHLMTWLRQWGGTEALAAFLAQPGKKVPAQARAVWQAWMLETGLSPAVPPPAPRRRL